MENQPHSNPKKENPQQGVEQEGLRHSPRFGKVPMVGDRWCYVCKSSRDLRTCEHCGSTVCASCICEGLCPLCIAARDLFQSKTRKPDNAGEAQGIDDVTTTICYDQAYRDGYEAAISLVRAKLEKAGVAARDYVQAVLRELEIGVRP